MPRHRLQESGPPYIIGARILKGESTPMIWTHATGGTAGLLFNSTDSWQAFAGAHRPRLPDNVEPATLATWSDFLEWAAFLLEHHVEDLLIDWNGKPTPAVALAEVVREVQEFVSGTQGTKNGPRD